MAYPVEDAMPDPISPAPPFSAPYCPDDGEIAARLLARPALSAGQNARIDATATRLIEAIRGHDGGFGGVKDMLREFSLSTKEGLALMVMAEALLRVPDAATADRFIEDKLGQGDFAHHQYKIERTPGQRVGMGARPVRARDPARRNAARHPRPDCEASRSSNGARRDPAGDAADG